MGLGDEEERVALQERKELSFYKKLQASDNNYQITSTRFLFIRIIFIRIIRLRSGKNKNNLRIIKAQILPKDKLKSKENRA